MKKLLTLLVGLMLLVSMIPSVFAAVPPSPTPIIGKLTLNGAGLDGYVISVQNVRTGNTVSGNTIPSLVTERGGFTVDLSKIGFIEPSEVYVGDTIKVSVNGLSDPQATVNIIPDPTPYYFDIAIVNTQVIYVCHDGSTVANEADCPEVEPELEEPVEDETKVVSSADGKSASVEAYLGQTIDICVTDNKVSKLLDEEIKYDGEGYDIHEEACFKGITLTSLDDEDYGLDPFINIVAGDVTYTYVFEDSLPFDDIHSEEPLEITLLGKDITIIYASDNEIVLRTGKDYFIREGETKGGVEVQAIGENSVQVNVAGTSQIISDGDSRDVNGKNILVNEILYKTEGNSFVELIIGTEGDIEIKDGDDVELFIKDDETYKWVIDLPNSIGVVNIEDYRSIDEDEEYKPIGIGGSIGLPNDYIVFGFSEMSESDVIDLTFKVDDGFLNIKGDSNSDTFIFGSDEYDEVNVDADGIYDEDNELITTDKVRIGDSDIYLELGSVKIGLLTIKLDMSDILYDGISFAGAEENFLDYLGIIFKDPENAVEDESGFKVSVPEERPEVTLTIGTEVIVPPDDVVDVIDDDITDDTTDDVVIVEPPIVVPLVEPPVVEPPVTPPVEPESKVFEMLTYLLGLILAALGVKWRLGFLGLAKYQWNKGNKLTAIKMLITATKRAKEDYYKKK